MAERESAQPLSGAIHERPRLSFISLYFSVNITVHGFRSLFSDWVPEQTSFSHETREYALTRQISDNADSAYRRGDQFERRRS